MRAIHRRFRAALLDALSTGHRSQVGSAIGACLVSEHPDKRSLHERIGLLLEDVEAERVAVAMVAFFDDQCKLQQASQPQTPANCNEARPTSSIEPSRAASILAGWLLAPEPLALETMSFEDFHKASPFRFSNNDSADVTQRMRSNMLRALAPDRRERVGEAIGQYVVAYEPNLSTLAERIDAILADDEANGILTAYATFLRFQKESLARANERLAQMQARRSAHDRQPAFEFPQEFAESPEDSDAGAVLAKSLLMAPMTITARFEGPDR